MTVRRSAAHITSRYRPAVHPVITRLAPAVVAGAVGLTFVSPAPASEATTASTPLATASVVVGPLMFDGPDCTNVPVTVAHERVPPRTEDIDLIVSLDLRQPGSNRSSAVYPRVTVTGEGRGTLRDSIQVCPSEYSDEAGDFVLTGELLTYSFLDGSSTTVPIPSRTLSAIKNVSRFASLKLTGDPRRSYQLAGSATASTLTRGDVGAEGTVTVSVRKPRARDWQEVANVPTDNFGRWRASLGPLAKGTRVRATLEGCEWCTDIARTLVVK